MRKLDPLTGKEMEREITKTTFDTTDDDGGGIIAHLLLRDFVVGRGLVLVAAVSEPLTLRRLSLSSHGPDVCT